MKRMGILGYLSVAFLLAGCSPEADDSCQVQSDCVDGYVCYQGKCEQRDHLMMETDSLPNAVVGVDYQVSMKASGGVVPYSWSLDEGPQWLSINEDSGLLSGIPDEAVANVQVVVRVKDSSDGDGQSASVTLMLTVVECVDGTAKACFEVQAGKCAQGNTSCASGKWGECSGLVVSSRMDHCGPECGQCDLGVSDGCYLGTCTCGDGPACADGQACCLQECVDVNQNTENCGQCGLNCTNQVQGASSVHCEMGKCDYDACDEDRLDCDGDRSNGCETVRDMDNCSFCGQPCVGTVKNATGLSCIQNEDNGEYACDYEQCDLGFFDCDADRSNGCEIEPSVENCGGCGVNCGDNPDGMNCVLDEGIGSYRCGCNYDTSCDGGAGQCCDKRCFARDDPMHCGDCTTVCDDPARPFCIKSYEHLCGCDSNEQCGQGRICCDQHCIDIDEQNCGECGRVCDAKIDHGSRCDLDTGTCYCEGPEDCRLSGFAMSAMSCRNSVCVCEWSEDPLNPVDPTYPNENVPCCGRQWVFDFLSNPLACGQCGVQCQGDCLGGGCACSSDSDCPKYSTATSCDLNQGRCVCSDNPDGNLPCQDGRSCCNGEMGGSGGPDGGQDLGCCWYQCGNNEPGDCLY